MKWNELTMAEKSQMMKVFLENGVSDLDTMRNTFDKGGPLKHPNDNLLDPTKNVAIQEGTLIPTKSKYTPSPIVPDDFIYSAGMLPEVEIVANDGMTDYQRAHLKETKKMKERVAKRPDQAWVPENMLTFGSAPFLLMGLPTTGPQAVNLTADALVGTLGALLTNRAISNKTGYNSFGQWLARDNPKYANIAELLNPVGYASMGLSRMSNPFRKLDLFPGNVKRGNKKLDEALTEAESFMRNDVDLRKKDTPYLTTEKVHPRERIQVKELPSGIGGQSNPITHNIDLAAIDVNPSTVIHELDHREKDLTALANPKKLNLSTDEIKDFELMDFLVPGNHEKEIFPIKQQELLNNAYDDISKKAVGTLREFPLYEKSATNREVRYAIMKKANINPVEHNAKQKIDQAINDISDVELMAILGKTNGYSQVFLKNILKKGHIKESLNLVRKALIGVPMIAYGINSEQNK